MEKEVYERSDIANLQQPFIFNIQWLVEGDSVYSHWHENIEVLCCIDGQGTVICDSDIINVKKGDTVIINTRCIHSIMAKSSFKYYFLMIDNSYFAENGINKENIYFKRMFTDEASNKIFDNINETYETEDEFSLAKKRSSVLEYILFLCKNYSMKNIKSEKVYSKVYNRVVEVMDYINQNYAKKIALDEIAEVAGYSKYHFARLFKDITGFTIVEHINAKRCGEAKKLLIKTDKPVSQICYECGFESCSYFSKTFKKLYGCMPSQYRKRAIKK